MDSLSNWLQLDDEIIAGKVAEQISTAVIYLNGTRRWFLTQSKNWADYGRIAGLAHRELCQLLYHHGLQTLIQPLLGYDILTRGPDYLKLAIEQGLGELTQPAYREWYHRQEIRVTFYGNWFNILTEFNFSQAAELSKLAAETSSYTRRKLLLGVFADEGLDNIVSLARHANRGEALLEGYYGQPVGPVDLIIGSGQPVIWDLPLLNINKANLYFLQAPTFCLNREALRQILFDCLYQRINDDKLYDDLTTEAWRKVEILGIGQRTEKGWIAL